MSDFNIIASAEVSFTTTPTELPDALWPDRKHPNESYIIQVLGGTRDANGDVVDAARNVDLVEFESTTQGCNFVKPGEVIEFGPFSGDRGRPSCYAKAATTCLVTLIRRV